jgi:hypothetical protein
MGRYLLRRCFNWFLFIDDFSGSTRSSGRYPATRSPAVR